MKSMKDVIENDANFRDNYIKKIKTTKNRLDLIKLLAWLYTNNPYNGRKVKLSVRAFQSGKVGDEIIHLRHYPHFGDNKWLIDFENNGFQLSLMYTKFSFEFRRIKSVSIIQNWPDPHKSPGYCSFVYMGLYFEFGA